MCTEPFLGSNRMWILLILHDKKQVLFFDVLLTVHLSIILVINQLNAQILVLQVLCAAWTKRKLSSALAILLSKRYGLWKDGVCEEANQSAIGISASSSAWLTCDWYCVCADTVVTWNALLRHSAWQRYANSTGLSPYSVCQFPFETQLFHSQIKHFMLKHSVLVSGR